jgi:hypothetical protein
MPLQIVTAPRRANLRGHVLDTTLLAGNQEEVMQART